jgi:hypothetical protein
MNVYYQYHRRPLRTVVDEFIADTDLHCGLPFLTFAVPSCNAFILQSSKQQFGGQQDRPAPHEVRLPLFFASHDQRLHVSQRTHP